MKVIKQRERLYIKTVAISPEDLDFVRSIKDKKSAAGKISEMINHYKKTYVTTTSN